MPPAGDFPDQQPPRFHKNLIIMKKIFLILFALMLTICGDAVAQTSRTISGTVEDARKEPIIGATIRIDGIPSGTMTDHDGKFKLKLPANKNCTLIVSCFG